MNIKDCKDIIKCDLCGRPIPACKAIPMVNKINKNTITVCKECYKEFWGQRKEK